MPTPSSECLYCQNNDTLKSLMIKICDLSVSKLFLFKEQSYLVLTKLIMAPTQIPFRICTCT